MKTIPVQQVGDVLAPSTPIPESATRVVCDGQNYTVYEAGDTLPPDPNEGATQ